MLECLIYSWPWKVFQIQPKYVLYLNTFNILSISNTVFVIKRNIVYFSWSVIYDMLLLSHLVHNRPISQIPQCIRKISHNATFCNRNVHTCTHFCYQMLHCGIWHRCILGFVIWVYSWDGLYVWNTGRNYLTHWPVGDMIVIYELLSLNIFDGKSTLVQEMAWRHHVTCHHLSQCWPRSILPHELMMLLSCWQLKTTHDKMVVNTINRSSMVLLVSALLCVAD